MDEGAIIMTPPAMLVPATYNPQQLPILDRAVAEAQARGWQVQDLRPQRALPAVAATR